MKAVRNSISAFTGKMAVCAIALLMCSSIAFGQAQANAADLTGTVVDPNGAVVPGATVSARNLATNISRTTTSADDGTYKFIALAPGEYEVTTEAATFKKVAISPVRLTVGQSADLKISLEIGGQDVIVNVSGDDIQLIETTRTNVATTIDQERIQNLPINERSATGFALTISTVGRDNGRPIGPAPTSGLNIGGQRGRSTLVQVDGADFTDNSINAARSTVSQEAVQEYQVATTHTRLNLDERPAVSSKSSQKAAQTNIAEIFRIYSGQKHSGPKCLCSIAKPDFAEHSLAALGARSLSTVRSSSPRMSADNVTNRIFYQRR